MLKQQLNQKLLQKLSPQQIQLMKLIQLPTQALEQKIKEELESNPALEEGSEESEAQEEDWEQQESTETEDSETIEAEDIDVDEYLSDDETPDYRLKANNHAKDDEETKVPITGGTTFTELLMEQIRTSRLSEEDRQIAEFIIGNIDDDGYIRRDLPKHYDHRGAARKGAPQGTATGPARGGRPRP
jgi:RNA polymerase sigma-54 factor